MDTFIFKCFNNSQCRDKSPFITFLLEKFMPYEIYKLIHFASIFLSLVTLALALIGNLKDRWIKIMSGVSGVLIFVSGMGLLARLGVSHGEGFPFWVKGKIFFWAILAIGGPIAVKRLKLKRTPAFFVFIGVVISAAYFAIYKV
jgi:uncharacterized membrane protein SirB2